MEYEYSPFWFMLLLVVGAIFISLAILFGLQFAWSIYVEDYKDCIDKDIPPHICDMIFPPLNEQNV